MIDVGPLYSDHGRECPCVWCDLLYGAEPERKAQIAQECAELEEMQR